MPIGRHKLSIFRALLLLVPLGFCGWWLWQRKPPAESTFDAALDRALAPVIEQRAAQAKLGASTSTQTRLLARQLALSSVPYLAARDLDLWADIRERVAQRSSVACARIWKGADEAFIGTGVAELGDDALQSYTELLARGFALRLERKPPPIARAGAVERGFQAVAANLPEPERATFQADVARPDVSDERACQLLLTLEAGIDKLDPATRTEFYRALGSRLPKSD